MIWIFTASWVLFPTIIPHITKTINSVNDSDLLYSGSIKIRIFFPSSELTTTHGLLWEWETHAVWLIFIYFFINLKSLRIIDCSHHLYLLWCSFSSWRWWVTQNGSWSGCLSTSIPCNVFYIFWILLIIFDIANENVARIDTHFVMKWLINIHCGFDKHKR